MNILHIDCSPREHSHSRQLSAGIVARLLEEHPEASIVRCDLGRSPPPHAAPDYAETLSAPGAMTSERARVATLLSEQFIRDIEMADALVIGTPMNNFTVPSVLKAWIDQILRMGRTIGTVATGEKVGLLEDKPVYIGIASGGVFTGDRARQPDFMIPYLTAALGCIGLKSLQFFPLQATAFLDSERLTADRRALIASVDTKRALPI